MRIFQLARAAAVCVVLATLAACGGGTKTQQYAVEGQIIGTAPQRREVTLAHKDIPNFMPAMTMAYFVKDAKELDGIAAGDLVTATLVLRGSEIYLQNVRKTGHRELPPDARPSKVMDVMQPGDTVPDDPLVDQAGVPRTLSQWRGKVLAVTFIYTRCPLPDFCPLMDRHFAEVQRRIATDDTLRGLRGNVQLVTVSFDPEHDTPDVLMAHAAAVKADLRTWAFLTGTTDAVDHVAERFGVSVIKESDPAKTITHSLRTAVVDRQGRVTTIYTGNEWTPDQLIDALVHALKQ